MSNETTPTPDQPTGRTRTISIPPHVLIEGAACSAIDDLSVSLLALQMAMEAANKAPGMLGLPDEDGHLSEACELRSRWCAAAQLLNAAIRKVDADGKETIKAVKAMLALE